MLRTVRVVCQVVSGYLLAAALLSGSANALEPEHEMRRLMLATEAAVKSESWGEASEYLNRLQQMEQEKPTDYLFYRGRVMLESGHFNEAQSALEGYVDGAGAEGELYTEALELITQVERVRKNEKSAGINGAAAKAEPVAIIEPAGDSSASKLRQLYLVDSDAEALVIHLNTLLDTVGWRADQQVVRLDEQADITFKVSRQNDSLNFQEARRETSGRMVRTTESLSVFGVNPRIEWGCVASESACWIYDPRDGSRLMQLVNNRGEAEEIAQTLGRLISTMQSPD